MLTALCFDIGGSKYNVGLVREDGEILDQELGRWSGTGAQGVLNDLYDAADRLLNRVAQPQFQRVGITIPGLADPEQGLWLDAPFSGIRNFPIARELERRYGVPARADNDGQACCLAEHCFGSCQGGEDFFYMTVSNGVGGAAFLNGKLYTGLGGAGEIGHCVVEEQSGRRCPCGGIGCLEAHAAGPGLSRTYQELGGTLAEDGSAPDAKEIARRARLGEAIAQETFRLEGEYLGRAIAWVFNLLNLPVVVLGGGISLAFDLFSPSLHQALEHRVFARANPSPLVRPTPLGYNGGLYGAAALAFFPPCAAASSIQVKE